MEFNSAELTKINDLLIQFPNRTELAVAKIVNGVPCYYGATHIDKNLSELDNQSDVFEIGSITKVFTSSLLASMVVRGELAIDDPINPYLPITVKNNQQILFEELATHTSGLAMMPPGIIWAALFKNRDNPTKDYDEARLMQYLENHLKLKKKNIAYSNLGVALLGLVLTKISGRSYEELLIDTIFSPIGMTNSTVNRKKLTSRLVNGLNRKGQTATYSDLGVFEAAGSVLSTTEDLVKFALENFNEDNRALAYQRKVFREDKVQPMALGWSIVNRIAKGERIYFHDGGTAGFSSAMVIDIVAKNGIILLSNISGYHKMKGHKLRGLAVELIQDILATQ